MSGGYFEYNQYKIEDMIDQIEDLIENNKIKNEWGYCNNYNQKTINKFKKAIKQLKIAYVYAQRVDWLVSGDDGEETFHERLKNDLDELKS